MREDKQSDRGTNVNGRMMLRECEKADAIPAIRLTVNAIPANRLTLNAGSEDKRGIKAGAGRAVRALCPTI